MHRFRRILAVADARPGSRVSSSPALARAVQLAKRNSAHLTVIDVIPELPSFLVSQIADLQLDYERRHNARMRALQNWARDEAVTASINVLHGRPASAIVRQVLLGGHDLLIKDVHVEEGTERLFGGTDLRLMRNCPCPVCLVRPEMDQSFERVLAAIDPQPTKEGQVLNEQLIHLACSMSAMEGSETHVVSAWQGLSEFDDNSVDGHDDRVYEQAAKTVLEACLSATEAGVPAGNIHFRRGTPGSVISSTARKLNVDLIVMGTLARTGVARLLIGNTAERVLRDVNCSVLTVKPSGFVSPIRLEDEVVASPRPVWSPA